MNLYRQSTAQIQGAISFLSHSPNLYEEFVAKNASAVSQIESGLRSVTYIIPGNALYLLMDRPMLTHQTGRFRDSELASESSIDPNAHHLPFALTRTPSSP